MQSLTSSAMERDAAVATSAELTKRSKKRGALPATRSAEAAAGRLSPTHSKEQAKSPDVQTAFYAAASSTVTAACRAAAATSIAIGARSDVPFTPNDASPPRSKGFNPFSEGSAATSTAGVARCDAGDDNSAAAAAGSSAAAAGSSAAAAGSSAAAAGSPAAGSSAAAAAAAASASGDHLGSSSNALPAWYEASQPVGPSFPMQPGQYSVQPHDDAPKPAAAATSWPPQAMAPFPMQPGQHPSSSLSRRRLSHRPLARGHRRRGSVPYAARSAPGAASVDAGSATALWLVATAGALRSLCSQVSTRSSLSRRRLSHRTLARGHRRRWLRSLCSQVSTRSSLSRRRLSHRPLARGHRRRWLRSGAASVTRSQVSTRSSRAASRRRLSHRPLARGHRRRWLRSLCSQVSTRSSLSRCLPREPQHCNSCRTSTLPSSRPTRGWLPSSTLRCVVMQDVRTRKPSSLLAPTRQLRALRGLRRAQGQPVRSSSRWWGGLHAAGEAALGSISSSSYDGSRAHARRGALADENYAPTHGRGMRRGGRDNVGSGGGTAACSSGSPRS